MLDQALRLAAASRSHLQRARTPQVQVKTTVYFSCYSRTVEVRERS